MARNREKVSGPLGYWGAGLIALLAAVPLAFIIAGINNALPLQPERATMIVGVLFGGLLVVPPIVYVCVRRRSVVLAHVALMVLAIVCVELVAIYLYLASFDVFFPADILIWSESDFVNDILKFHLNYPLFTAQVNNESFTYMPGAQLLTYFFAWLTGNAGSISAYRLIHLGYTLIAAFVAFSCIRQLIEVVRPSLKSKSELWWGAVWLPLLFLIATNSQSNPFAHLLHNDALAQLITIVAYWVLLRYALTGNKRLLWLMVIIPVAGFWVKQSLAIWAALYCVQLAVFQQPRSFKRLLILAGTAFSAIAVSVAIGYGLWGANFTYWVFTVLGKHGVSPLRSFQHLLDIWPYFAIGLLGGMVLLRGEKFRQLLGPWVIWVALISLQTYTSGVAWMLNHIGPGCLVAGIWFIAAFNIVWPDVSRATPGRFKAQDWIRVGGATAVICLLFSGLGVIRVPVRPFGDDASRYVKEIESEFHGHAPANVLLDMGTWIYAPAGVVMKDRVPSIGERGYSQTGDFSGIIQRLAEKRYTKILVRNLHSPDFWYDGESWSKSSGIRQAILDNYTEVGKIEPVAMQYKKAVPYGFSEVSILVPRTQ